MRRTACRFASRAAWSATASTRARSGPADRGRGSRRAKFLGPVGTLRQRPALLTSLARATTRRARSRGWARSRSRASTPRGRTRARRSRGPVERRVRGPVRRSPQRHRSAKARDPPQPRSARTSRALAADVTSRTDIARARALRLLSQMTLFIDHHDAVLAVPEVRSRAAGGSRAGDAVDERERRTARVPFVDVATRCLATREMRGPRRARPRARAAPRRRDAAILAAERSNTVCVRRPAPTRRATCAELAADDATHTSASSSRRRRRAARSGGLAAALAACRR